MYSVNKVLKENCFWVVGFALLVVDPKSLHISQNAFAYNVVVLMQRSTFQFPVILK
jgi:hypothetical protein